MKRSIHCLLLAFASIGSTAPAQDIPSARALSQSFDILVPQAPTPVPVEGKVQLTYELHLTNFSSEPLSVKRLRITDPAGRVIIAFDGAALAQRLAVVANDGKETVAPGQRAILFVEIDALPGAVPRTLLHTIDYTAPGSEAIYRTEGAPLTVGSAPLVILGPPLAGGPWAAVHLPAWPRGHRRVTYTIDGRGRIPGRYAIDFIKLDPQGRTTAGDVDRTDAAFGYGAPVLAVADGVIVGLRDDAPESAQISRNPAHPLGEGAGNHVALRLPGGEVAFYEHLRPGSVRVRIGEAVRRGQRIGALGFTGDTTGPHLHFHLAEANSLLGAEGIPFVFDRFALLGGIGDIASLGKGPWQAAAHLAPDRRMEWPGFNSVVTFADVRPVESLSRRTTRR